MAPTTPVQALLALGLLLCVYAFKVYRGSQKRWVNVPVVGGSSIIGSWIESMRYHRTARALIQEGYEKHKNYAFQVAAPSRWEIFICNEAMIKEYRSLDSHLMSANAVTAEFFQAQFTMPGAAEGIHKIGINILAKGLTWQRMRSATKEDPYFSEFYDEFMYAFSEEMPVGDEGWTVIQCFKKATRIVSHITAKTLIGRPLCRDPEILEIFCQYGAIVPPNGWFIAKFPEFLKPLAASLCAAPKIAARLEVIVLESMRQRRANGLKTPNDLVEWMMKWVDENAASEFNDRDIALQIVALVFGAIHTTTQLLVHCLFEISIRTEYVEPLRQEVNECLKEYGGWNKEALEAMTKIDSFARECQRYNPLDAGSMARRVSTDFAFSNGLRVPAGNYIFAPNTPVLCDPDNYPDPEKFDGYRYYRLRQEPGQNNNHTLISTSPKNLQFGDGRHVCPGRYMAADEIRLMLAHIVINFDVAIKDHAPRPANTIFTKILFPDLSGEVMLRKIRT